MEICFIQFVLRYSEVTSGYLIGTMVVNLHDNNWRDILFDPSVIAESLAEAVASDFADNTDGGDSCLDDAPCLDPANRGFLAATVRENILSPAMGEVEPESLEDLLVEGDRLLLAGFMLDEREVAVKLPALFFVNIVPAESKEVADPQRRTGRHNNHGIIAILASEEKIVGEVLKLLFVADWFGSFSHDIERSFAHDALGNALRKGTECNSLNREQHF